ncbi:hypothetical protein ACVWZA_001048 [Sphingomonas sp. UYAg733]
MMTFVGLLVFAGAFAAALAVFAFTLMPAMPRIVAILSGREDPILASTHRLTVRDRRLAARSRPVTPVAMRAAA